MFSSSLIILAKRLLKTCEDRGIMLVTAESCTGGLIVGLLTEIPGSSAVVDRGFVTYSDEAKQELLDVKKATLARHGTVSSQAAKEMAEGAVKHSGAQLGIAVTGIAGPGGGGKTKPVGLVYIAVALKKHKTIIKEYHFNGNRSAVRLAAIKEALALAIAASARYA